jgi:hypothetical protein
MMVSRKPIDGEKQATTLSSTSKVEQRFTLEWKI